jgi:hypothetical protein
MPSDALGSQDTANTATQIILPDLFCRISRLRFFDQLWVANTANPASAGAVPDFVPDFAPGSALRFSAPPQLLLVWHLTPGRTPQTPGVWDLHPEVPLGRIPALALGLHAIRDAA